MPRPDKVSAVAEIADAFRTSNAAVLTEYRGLSVKELTQLRRALGAGTSFAIVKNTLTKIAAKDAGVDGLGELLTGPTAVAFVDGDPVEAAKGLRDFARTHPALVLKGGVLEGKPLSAQEIRRLADLESREVLLAKLAGAMQGSLVQGHRHDRGSAVPVRAGRRRASGPAGFRCRAPEAAAEPGEPAEDADHPARTGNRACLTACLTIAPDRPRPRPTLFT